MFHCLSVEAFKLLCRAVGGSPESPGASDSEERRDTATEPLSPLVLQIRPSKIK